VFCQEGRKERGGWLKPVVEMENTKPTQKQNENVFKTKTRNTKKMF
jgi:hypothetical protein